LNYGEREYEEIEEENKTKKINEKEGNTNSCVLRSL